MGSLKPATSTVHQDATWSYQKVGDQSIWGPFCCQCMNRWKDFFQEDTGIFLHLKSYGKFFKLAELKDQNGAESPFSLKSLSEEVRKNPCYYEKCPQKAGNPIPEEPTRPSSKVSNSTDDNKSSEKGRRIRRNLPRENPSFVTDRRPVEFPLLHGTAYRMSKAITEETFKARAREALEVYWKISHMKEAVQVALDEFNWKTINCEVCEYIDPSEPYIEHVLSLEHFNNLRAHGRWLTIQHFDVFDAALNKQLKIVRNNSGWPERQERTAVQKYPLFAMWNSPNTTQMPKKEYETRMDLLSSLLESCDQLRLNEKYPLKELGNEVCFWCGDWVSSMSNLIRHLVGARHQEMAYQRSKISVKDINFYINITRECAQKSASSSASASPAPQPPAPNPSASSQTVNDKRLLTVPFLVGTGTPVCAMTQSEVAYCRMFLPKLKAKLPAAMTKINDKLVTQGQWLLNCETCDKRLSSPVSALEHVFTDGHLNKTASRGVNNKFCKVADYCRLISILLDGFGMSHSVVSLKNADEYTKKVEVALGLAGTSSASNPATTASSPHLLKVPFLVGTSKPVWDMSRDEAVKFGLITRSLLVKRPDVMSRIDEQLRKKGAYLLRCAPCNKNFSSPVSALQHCVGEPHISQVLSHSKDNKLCKGIDLCILVSILLDGLGVSHPTIRLDNLDEHLEKVRAAVEPPPAPPSTTGPKTVPVTIGKLDDPRPKCPFLHPKTNPSNPLTEEQCLELVRPFRNIIFDNPKVKRELEGNTSLENFECRLCYKKLNRCFATLEHVLSKSHISKIYSMGKVFCREADYLNMVKLLKPKKDDPTEVTLANAAEVIRGLEPPNSKKTPPSKENTPPKNPNPPARSSSTVSVASASSIASIPPSLLKEKGCRMTCKTSRAVVFMNVDTRYSTVLTDEQLQTLCSAVKRLLYTSTRDFGSQYAGLVAICPVECPLCQFRGLCCCDYIFHLFESTHYNRIVEERIKVSVQDVHFWMRELWTLRKYSKLDVADDAIDRCWASIGISFKDEEAAPTVSQLDSSHYVQ